MSGTISTVTDDEYLTSLGFENAMARAEFTSSLARSDEWKAITGAALAPGDMLKIQAVAGAGKTTVLTDFMAQRPQERFLFVAYNKSIVDSFPARFREAGLENVEVRTMHSIAFEGTRDIHRTKNKRECRWAWQIERALELPTKSIAPEEASSLSKALTQFVNSCDSVADSVALGKSNSRARQLWERIVDPTRQHAPISHDAYLKAFSLDGRRVREAFQKYSYVIVDEAQDCSDCMIAVVASSRRMGKRVIYAYDTNQTIYQFKHVTGARLRKEPATLSLRLSQTFRFGPPLDAITTAAVRFFGAKYCDDDANDPSPGGECEEDEAAVDCNGASAESRAAVASSSSSSAAPTAGPKEVAIEPLFTVTSARTNHKTTVQRADVAPYANSALSFSASSKLAIIARRNATLFKELVAVVGHFLQQSKTTLAATKIHFVGGLNNAFGGFGPLIDLHHLRAGEQHLCNAKQLREWRGGFKAYKENAEKASDMEALVKIDIVETHFPALPRIHAAAKAMNTEEPSSAALVFSTVHKAKGLQFPRVYILDDFFGLGDEPPAMWRSASAFNHATKQRALFEEPFEEVNIAYVAMTRAEDELWLHPTTWAWLTPCGIDYFSASTSISSSTSSSSSSSSSSPLSCLAGSQAQRKSLDFFGMSKTPPKVDPYAAPNPAAKSWYESTVYPKEVIDLAGDCEEDGEEVCKKDGDEADTGMGLGNFKNMHETELEIQNTGKGNNCMIEDLSSSSSSSLPSCFSPSELVAEGPVCSCGKTDDTLGPLVACDNSSCKFGSGTNLFHLSCVRQLYREDGIWLCPGCVRISNTAAKRTAEATKKIRSQVVTRSSSKRKKQAAAEISEEAMVRKNEADSSPSVAKNKRIKVMELRDR